MVSGHAYAHDVETDGSIEVLMHIAPSHEPTVGELNDFFFQFTDKKGAFEPLNCDCFVTVLESGKPLFSDDLGTVKTELDVINPSFSLAFPRKNIYTIKVTGKPKDGVGFDSFTIEYSLRVDKEGIAKKQPMVTQKKESISSFVEKNLAYLIIGLIGVSLLLKAYFLKK